MKRLLALLLTTAPAVATPAFAQDATWQPKTTADLILLDKIRGQPSPMTVKVGHIAKFGSLTVKVRSCMVRSTDQAADAASFVDVTDTRGNVEVFHGWLLLKEPAVSQMEHPVYDLRLAGCR